MIRNPQFFYNKPNAKCIFCSRTKNPHPDFNEPIVTALFSYNNKEIEVCINCYGELEESSSDQNKSMNSLLQDKLNISRIFAKGYRNI